MSRSDPAGGEGAGAGGALRGKTILIVSPQEWTHIPVSKHHYALELARRGNRVYFLEPPRDVFPIVPRLGTEGMPPGVTRVQYRPFFPQVLRFHLRPVFDRLMSDVGRQVARAIGETIDLVWCFDVNLFADLRCFGGRAVVFHPVDPLTAPYQVRPARTADLVLSVSEEILSRFDGVSVPRAFVNHGLADEYVRYARQPYVMHDATPPNVGYSGNLIRPAVNQRLVMETVAANPGAVFHFWGPVDTSNAGAVADDVAALFQFLRGAPNVRLHGVKSPAALAAEMQEMDAFFLIYSLRSNDSDRSNSHKILEYLSTGRAVVSSQISTYAGRPDLLITAAASDDADIPMLVRDVLADRARHNDVSRAEVRRSFALANTYGRQVDRIEALMQEHGLIAGERA